MDISDKIVSLIWDEYTIAKQNHSDRDDDFEKFIGLLDSEPQEREYEWMSDIRLPEFASHWLTQSSIDVNQYFQSRDFVECYLEDEGDQAKANAGAARELINRTLNQKHLYHYMKFVRAKGINHLLGHVYAVTEWEKDTREGVVGFRSEARLAGNEISIDNVAIRGEVVITDRFNYEIVDPRRVFTSSEYVYNIQEKEFVIVLSDKSLSQLKASADRMDYDLSEIENAIPPEKTETQQIENDKQPTWSADSKFDLLTRFGKMWCMVSERADDGYPTKVTPGIDSEGNIKDGAELHKVISTVAFSGNSRYLIRFQVTPYISADGEPYYPLLRGLCYVHPTNDEGVGDGKYSNQLQNAIDDTFNLSNDRTMLATIPVLRGRKYSMEDNDTVYFEPGHVIEEREQGDIQEFKITDNISAALQQLSILSGKMDQVQAIFPTTMGNVPTDSSTTATAVVGAENRSTMRGNYKSMTFENTFLTDLYWQIQQMTYQFATEQTARKLLGSKVYDFDPSRDYYYKPVSQSIETEQAKANKVRLWIQVLGYVSNVEHPDAVKLVNYILSQIALYMGDEYVNFANKLLNEGQPMGTGAGPQANNLLGMSNQNAVPMSAMEMGVRGNA